MRFENFTAKPNNLVFSISRHNTAINYNFCLKILLIFVEILYVRSFFPVYYD
jgi:hypothetical protein